MNTFNERIQEAAKVSEAAISSAQAMYDLEHAKRLETLGDIGNDLHTILIHKEGAEGVLIIGADSGLVQQPIDERPEWAAGHLVALLAERQEFYMSRAGVEVRPNGTRETAIAYEDLGWIIVGEDGTTESETQADTEFRMNAVATYAGMERNVESVAELAASLKASGADFAVLSYDADEHTESEARAIVEATNAEVKDISHG